MEPVNGGALDKSREAAGPDTKCTAHGRQTQYHLQRRRQGDKESPKHTYTNRSVQTCNPILEHDKIYSQVHIGKSTQVIDITDASKRETHNWQPSVPPLSSTWHVDKAAIFPVGWSRR